jgi:HEAT repeat protein
MSRRRLFRIGVLFLVALAGVLLIPDVRFELWGRLRGEPRFRDKPACAWSSAVRDWDRAAGAPALPPVLTRLLGLFGLGRFGAPDEPAVLNGGPEAVPVLSYLLGDGDPAVCRHAAYGLQHIGPAARDAVPALARALKNPDRRVGQQVAQTLTLLGPEAADAVPALTEALQDQDESLQVHAALALGKIGPAARAAVPVLAALLAAEGNAPGGEQTKLRVYVAQALWRIDRRSDLAVPALLAAMKDKNSAYRGFVAAILGEIGPEARPAVAALVQIAKDPGGVGRDDAVEALKKIDP